MRNHEVEFLAHGSRLEYSPEILREATLRVEQKAVQSDTWCALAIRKDVDDVVKCKSKFSLSELSDVMWGLLRMAIESSGSGDVTSYDALYRCYTATYAIITHSEQTI